MKIGIDASRAFIPKRTGVEEYSYQVIRHLMDKLDGHQIVLYIRKNRKIAENNSLEYFCHGKNIQVDRGNFKIRPIKFPYLWTQLGLSLEMLLHPVDVLFIPSHAIPVIHPKNTVVTIHGLEYETCPKMYSFWGRAYLYGTRLSCRWAKKIIAVSKNTKSDLMKLYKVPADKIEVIYEGVSVERGTHNVERKELDAPRSTLHASELKPYLLFIGRLEKRKNIEGIIDAYKILVEKYNIPHKLILAGNRGFGYEAISYKLKAKSHKKDIILPGYISEEEKNNLLKNADVFLFPTFYEGFGLPVLEAQSVGTPVVTSKVSSLPEIAGEGAAYCVPEEPVSIAEAVRAVLGDKEFRERLIKKGQENCQRFSWEKCAEKIAAILTEK